MRSCSCHHKGTCFNLIRYYSILRTMQTFDPFYTDNIGTCTLYICTHTIQEISQINHMWFFRSIFNNGLTVSHNSSHHNIDRCPYRNNIQINMIADQFLCIGIDDAMFNGNICTKCRESFNMLINRS